MSEWFENEAFWRECRGLLFDEGRMERAGGEIDWIAERTGIEPGARVLDLCCGIGRHAREFVARGYAVTGVDLEATYLAEASRAAPELETVQCDMRAFRREASFDLAINLYTSFGYFDDPDDDQRVLDNICASLRSGGQFVLDLKGKENLARVFEPLGTTELADDTLLVSRRRIEGDWEYCRTTWIVIRGGERREFTFRTRLYAATELRSMLRRAGFAEIEFRGSLAGAPFDHKSNRTVAIARKG